jgi:hypothetical protein
MPDDFEFPWNPQVLSQYGPGDTIDVDGVGRCLVRAVDDDPDDPDELILLLCPVEAA